jgi:hypothetical protein
MKKKFLRIMVLVVICLMLISGGLYFVFVENSIFKKNDRSNSNGEDDKQEMEIDEEDMNIDENNPKNINRVIIFSKEDDKQVAEIWVENEQLQYEVDNSAEDILQYLESQSTDWEQNGISYPIGECSDNWCWDGEVETTIDKGDFMNGVYVDIADEFRDKYVIETINKAGERE